MFEEDGMVGFARVWEIESIELGCWIGFGEDDDGFSAIFYSLIGYWENFERASGIILR